MRAQVIFNRQLEEAEQDNLLVGTAVRLPQGGWSVWVGGSWANNKWAGQFSAVSKPTFVLKIRNIGFSVSSFFVVR